MLHAIGDTRINVVEEGEGEPVVFLHSNLYSWRNWIPQLHELGARYRCVALDLRGYGSSDRTAPLGIERFADDVAAVCAALGIARTHVVGISLGGIVAQAVAIRHPALVRGLVLANTTSGSDPAVAERVRQAAQTIRADGLAAVLAANREATFSERFRAEQPERVRTVLREFGSTDPLTVAATSEALAGYDHLALLPTIIAPTLILHGDADGLMGRENSEVLAREIPGARMVVLEGSGHLSNLEAPDAFNAALVRFFDSLGAAAP